MDIRRVAMLLLAGWVGAASGNAQDTTRWHCAYAPLEGEWIACQLVQVPLGEAAAQVLPVVTSRLPKLVADIRNAPATLDGKTIVIPLHSPPIDMARAGLLARHVMCGALPACEVEFTAGRQGLVEPTHRAPSRPARRGR